MVQHLFFPHRYKLRALVAQFSNWRRHFVEARETLQLCVHCCVSVDLNVVQFEQLFVQTVGTFLRWLERMVVFGAVYVDVFLSSMMNGSIVIQYTLFWSYLALWKINWWELWIDVNVSLEQAHVEPITVYLTMWHSRCALQNGGQKICIEGLVLIFVLNNLDVWFKNADYKPDI